MFWKRGCYGYIISIYTQYNKKLMEISDDAYQMLKNDWTMWCVLNMFKGDKNTKSTSDANL